MDHTDAVHQCDVNVCHMTLKNLPSCFLPFLDDFGELHLCSPSQTVVWHWDKLVVVLPQSLHATFALLAEFSWIFVWTY